MEISGEQADLQVRDERYFRSGARGAEQELTQAEAERLSLDADDLMARADDHGLLLQDAPTPATSWLGGVRQTLPSNRLTVLVDTTTIHNARQALLTRGRAPSPIARLRLWRPEVYVLLNVAQEADRLSRLSTRIKEIWGSEPDMPQQRLLERFASLRAGPFLTPTALT